MTKEGGLVLATLVISVVITTGLVMLYLWLRDWWLLRKSRSESTHTEEQDELHPFQREEIGLSSPPQYLGGFVPPMTMTRPYLPVTEVDRSEVVVPPPRATAPYRVGPGSFTLRVEGVDNFTATTDMIRREIARQFNVPSSMMGPTSRPPNLPPVTQDNCMHFWKKTGRSRTCTVCAKTETLPEHLCPGGIHDFQQPIYKKDGQRTVITKVCKKCDYIERIPLKTVAELKQSKVRSMIFEKEDD